MSINTYLLLQQSVLHASAFVALALAAVYLVAAIAGWRGPYRRKRLVRLALCLGAVPIFPLIHAAINAALLYGLAFHEARQSERRQQEYIDAVSFVKIGDPAPSFSITYDACIARILFPPGSWRS